MFQANCYNVMIVSPSDVSNEREIVKNVLYKWNELNSRCHNIVFSVLGYDINAHADSGSHPQESLNRQLLKEADLIIAIFWTKLGTPTKEYSSGSVEEISKHIKEGKKALIYFNNKTFEPKDSERKKQYKKLMKYKESIKNEAFYKEFSSEGEFERVVKDDIQLIANYQLDPLLENFKVNSMIDRLRDVFEEYDVPPKLSDKDLKIIKEDIKTVPEEYRTRLLGFDVFGLPRTMFGKNSDDWLEFFKSAAVVLGKLNTMLLNQATKDIQKLMESDIKPLMLSAKIHLGFLSFFTYYVNRCALSILSAKSLPASVAEIMFSPEAPDHPDEIEEKCRNRALLAFRGLKVNSTPVAGNVSEFKESIWEYSCFNCNLNRQFENELKPLKPVCDQIIDSILDKYGKYSKTVIIHDLSIWDSSKYMEGVAQTMKSWKQELPSK